jgi:hypothetical protein
LLNRDEVQSDSLGAGDLAAEDPSNRHRTTGQSTIRRPNAGGSITWLWLHLNMKLSQFPIPQTIELAPAAMDEVVASHHERGPDDHGTSGA